MMQKWERRAFLFFGLNRSFNIKEVNNARIALSPNIKFLFSYGSYRASIEGPAELYRIVPSLTVDIYYKSGYAKLGYEYLNLKTSEFNPNRFVIKLGFKIKQKVYISKKKFDWI